MTTTPPNPVILADEPEFVEPPKWPKVVGIISIVWSIIGLGCGGCGIAGAFMGTFAGDMMKQQFDDGLPPQFTQGPSIGLIVSTAAGLLVALVLMTAGIVLLARKYAARSLHLLWVALAVLSTFWMSYIQLGISQETKQWVRDNPNTKYAQAQNQTATATLEAGMWVLGLSISLAYPIFCAVWFGFVKKDPEEYTRGIEQLV